MAIRGLESASGGATLVSSPRRPASIVVWSLLAPQEPGGDLIRGRDSRFRPRTRSDRAPDEVLNPGLESTSAPLWTVVTRSESQGSGQTVVHRLSLESGSVRTGVY
jgi:hypothetical protein